MRLGSLERIDRPGGYVVYEAVHRFKLERLAENLLRLAGVGMILIGYLMWFIPSQVFGPGGLFAQMAVSAISMGLGILVYLFARRGFRRVVDLNFSARSVRLARLNARNRALIVRELPLSDVGSVYVRRSEVPGASVSLCMRLKHSDRSIEMLAGDRADIEAAHQQLCEDVRIALQCAPRRPVRYKFKPARTARPNKRQAKHTYVPGPEIAVHAPAGGATV